MDLLLCLSYRYSLNCFVKVSVCICFSIFCRMKPPWNLTWEYGSKLSSIAVGINRVHTGVQWTYVYLLNQTTFVRVQKVFAHENYIVSFIFCYCYHCSKCACECVFKKACASQRFPFHVKVITFKCLNVYFNSTCIFHNIMYPWTGIS